MQKITSATKLRNTIELLKIEQFEKEQQLKEQFYLVIDSFHPFNILEQKLNDITSSSFITKNVIDTFLGLTAGYFSKMLIVGKSGNLFRKFSGSFIQFSVTKFIAKNAGAIKSLGQFVIQHIFSKR